MLRIHVEPSLNDPQTCKFVLSAPIHHGTPFLCHEQTSDAPLAKRLFALSGIAEILIDESVVTVTKKTETPWNELAPRIGQTLRFHAESGEQAVTLQPLPSDAEIATQVELLLQTEINPSVAGHGGNIELLYVQDRVVFLNMSGGCQGCGAAQLTLTYGIQNTIRKAIPSVLQIVDKTNHDEGKKPYFAPSSS